MKVLHISTSSSGGAAQAANRLHLALLKLGIDSSILYLHNKDHIKNSYELYKKDLSIFTKVLRRFKLYRTKSEETKKITSSLPKEKTMFSFGESDFDITQNKQYIEADIINLHWVSEFIDYPVFFRNNKKKIVWTLHDQNPFTGGCHYSDNCTNYETTCDNCPYWNKNQKLIHKTKRNLKLKKEAINSKPITVVTPSVWLMNLSKSSSLFQNYPHYTIPNGLDTTLFKQHDKTEARRKFSLSTTKKVLLFISDKLFEERKGFKILQDALTLINRDDIQLLAVGKQHSNEGNLNIQHTGHIDSEETMSYAYSAADAFILPSLQDNLPNTMLESLSCGTPVIGFPTGGIKEYVTTGETGILAEAISTEALANSITDFLSDKYIFDSTFIRDFALKNFDDTRQAKTYAELYKKL